MFNVQQQQDNVQQQQEDQSNSSDEEYAQISPRWKVIYFIYLFV